MNKKRRIKGRNMVSLITAFSFLVLVVTGVLSFSENYSRTLATVHTAFGLGFMVCVGFHLKSNWTSLFRYMFSRGK